MCELNVCTRNTCNLYSILKQCKKCLIQFYQNIGSAASLLPAHNVINTQSSRFWVVSEWRYGITRTWQIFSYHTKLSNHRGKFIFIKMRVGNPKFAIQPIFGRFWTQNPNPQLKLRIRIVYLYYIFRA